MKLIKELISKPIVEADGQKELELDEPNLNVEAAKLHREFTKPKFSGYFYSKPRSWEEAASYAANNKGPIKLDDLFDVADPGVVQDLEFSEKEVYGGNFGKPLKSFTPDFKSKNFDAFFVNTEDGMFAVRTEGADYARYVALVADEVE